MKQELMNYLDGKEVSTDFESMIKRWNELYIQDRANEEPNDLELTNAFIDIIHQYPHLASTVNAQIYVFKFISYFEGLCENVPLDNITIDRDILMEIMPCIACEDLNPCKLFLDELYNIAIEIKDDNTRKNGTFKYVVARALKENGDTVRYQEILDTDARLKAYFATHDY